LGTGSRPPVSIVIPAFGAADQLRACLDSLARHAPPGCPVLIADDATPDNSVANVAASFEPNLALTYLRRPLNLGFVENCNDAIRSILAGGDDDILLLNSDTEVTAGFLEEMWLVLHLHEKHGAVSPRSNNATIFSVPPSGGLRPDEAFQLWTSIRGLLPRYHVMPTAVGFCLLFKNIVLRRLGLFDPVYSPGYNEENDLICRINRHGYSAIAANRAFVFHFESSSFGPRKKALERRNAATLSERYPEYRPKIARYQRHEMDPVDHFSSLWRHHRPRILFDLFHLPAKHSGTSEVGLSLLVRLAPLLEPHYDLSLGLSEEARTFFASELAGYRFYDEGRQPELRFDLVFKPAQIFTWPELHRMIRLGGRTAYTHLDVIAVRCDYIAGPNTRAIMKTAAQLADRVFTISEFSRSDFAAFYNLDLPIEVIRLGTHEHPETVDRPGRYVLIVGNHFHHKAVRRAASALKGVAELVALGGEPNGDPDVRWLKSGSLSRSAMADLYQGAAVVVYPSFYEGFGIPVVDAVTRGLPVVALDTEVNREVRSLTGDGATFLVRDFDEMRSTVSTIISRPPTAVPTRPPRTWDEVAIEYARSFTDLLSRPLDVGLIRRRWEIIGTIDAVHPLR
jgi:GT2 family glycosyltransferase